MCVCVCVCVGVGGGGGGGGGGWMEKRRARHAKHSFSACLRVCFLSTLRTVPLLKARSRIRHCGVGLDGAADFLATVVPPDCRPFPLTNFLVILRNRRGLRGGFG